MRKFPKRSRKCPKRNDFADLKVGKVTSITRLKLTFLKSFITRPKIELDMRIILCLYLPGVQTQLYKQEVNNLQSRKVEEQRKKNGSFLSFLLFSISIGHKTKL